MEENWPMRKCTLPETGPVNRGERNIRAGQYLKGTKSRKTDSRRRIQVFGRRIKVRGSEVHDEVVPSGQPNCAARPVMRSPWNLFNDSTWVTMHVLACSPSGSWRCGMCLGIVASRKTLSEGQPHCRGCGCIHFPCCSVFKWSCAAA